MIHNKLAFKACLVTLAQQLCTFVLGFRIMDYVDGEGEAEAYTDGALGVWEAVTLGEKYLKGSEILTLSSPGPFCLHTNSLSCPSLDCGKSTELQ